MKENKPKGAGKVLISISQYSSSDKHEVSVAAKFQKSFTVGRHYSNELFR